MRNKKIWMSILSLLVLVACSSSSEDTSSEQATQKVAPIYAGEYETCVPFQSSNANIRHKDQTKSQDSLTITSQMMDISKEYFSVDTYCSVEGQVLDYDDLTLLLSRSSATPEGLNPQTGDFDTGNGVKQDVIIASDLYEMDWFKDDELSGMTLTLYINPYAQGEKIEISDAVLDAYIKDTIPKLISHLRTNVVEVQNQIPILISVFMSGDSEKSLPGNMMMYSYFEKDTTTVSSYQTIDSAWYIFPTDAATTALPDQAAMYTQMQNNMFNYLNSDVKMVGYGFGKDGGLDTLTIEVKMHAKTGSEAEAITQQLRAQVSSIFSSADFDVTISIVNNNEEYAMIQKLNGSSNVNIIQKWR